MATVSLAEWLWMTSIRVSLGWNGRHSSILQFFFGWNRRHVTSVFQLVGSRSSMMFNDIPLVGGLEHVFPIYYGDNHPNWRTHIFQRVAKNHQPAMIFHDDPWFSQAPLRCRPPGSWSLCPTSKRLQVFDSYLLGHYYMLLRCYLIRCHLDVTYMLLRCYLYVTYMLLICHLDVT